MNIQPRDFNSVMSDEDLSNYLNNYEDHNLSQNFLNFVDKGVEDFKDKHPKVKASLNKHPELEDTLIIAAKTGLTIGAVSLASMGGAYLAGAGATGAAGAGAAGAAGTGGAGIVGTGGAGIVGALIKGAKGALGSKKEEGLDLEKTAAMFKPAAQGYLTKRGVKTEGKTALQIAGLFYKNATGKNSGSNEKNVAFLMDFFGGLKQQKAAGKIDEEGNFLLDILAGTASQVVELGGNYLNNLITGKDTPEAPAGVPAAEKEGPAPAEAPKKKSNLVPVIIVIALILALK